MIYKDQLIFKPEVYAYRLGAYLFGFPGKLFQRLENITGFDYQKLRPEATILVKDGNEYIQYYIQDKGDSIIDRCLTELDFEELNDLFTTFTKSLHPIELSDYVNNSAQINLNIETIDYKLWLNENV